MKEKELCFIKYNCNSSKAEKCIKNVAEIAQKSIQVTETYTNILFLMKTKNGHILTLSEKMQISAILPFETCDRFCPMMSQMGSSVSQITNLNVLILQDKVSKILVRAQLWGKNCFLDQVSLLIEEMVTILKPETEPN